MLRLDRKLMFRLAQLAAVAVTALLVVALVGPKDASPVYRPTGEPLALPDTQLTEVTESEFGRMMVGLEGTPVVVNMWASWCPPCRAEMPLLERAAQDYEGRVVFLEVAAQDSPSAAREFLDEVGVTYPNLFDGSGEVGEVLDQRGFPTTYFFDADGELRESLVGGVTEPKLAAQLEDMVG